MDDGSIRLLCQYPDLTNRQVTLAPQASCRTPPADILRIAGDPFVNINFSPDYLLAHKDFLKLSDNSAEWLRKHGTNLEIEASFEGVFEISTRSLLDIEAGLAGQRQQMSALVHTVLQRVSGVVIKEEDRELARQLFTTPHVSLAWKTLRDAAPEDVYQAVVNARRSGLFYSEVFDTANHVRDRFLFLFQNHPDMFEDLARNGLLGFKHVHGVSLWGPGTGQCIS